MQGKRHKNNSGRFLVFQEFSLIEEAKIQIIISQHDKNHLYPDNPVDPVGKGDGHCWKRRQQMQRRRSLAMMHEEGGGAVHKLANSHVHALSSFGEKGILGRKNGHWWPNSYAARAWIWTESIEQKGRGQWKHSRIKLIRLGDD